VNYCGGIISRCAGRAEPTDERKRQGHPPSTRRCSQLADKKLRLAHELCFSINFAVPILLHNALMSAGWVGLGLGARLNDYLGLHRHSDVGQEISFCLLTFGLATCIFILLRLVSSWTLADFTLRYVGGLPALVGVPTVWLYMGKVLSPFIIVPAYFSWLWAETALASVGAIAFALTNWRMRFWVGAAALALHYGLWWRVFAAPPSVSLAWSLVFPVIGVCSVAVWATYLVHQPAIRPLYTTRAST